MATVDDAFAYAQSLSPADQQVLVDRLLEAMPRQDFRPPIVTWPKCNVALPSTMPAEWRRILGRKYVTKSVGRFPDNDQAHCLYRRSFRF